MRCGVLARLASPLRSCRTGWESASSAALCTALSAEPGSAPPSTDTVCGMMTRLAGWQFLSGAVLFHIMLLSPRGVGFSLLAG